MKRESNVKTEYGNKLKPELVSGSEQPQSDTNASANSSESDIASQPMPNPNLSPRAESFEHFCEVVRHLRAKDGCPWDRAQTHTSLKPYCIEEAAEVIGGINIWEATGDAESLKEELGDLLLQILLHAQIAEEEGLFTIREVIDEASEKMIRRHPHVFGKPMLSDQGEPLTDWEAIKRQEKAGKEWTEAYLPRALEEAKKLIERAECRKGIKK